MKNSKLTIFIIGLLIVSAAVCIYFAIKHENKIGVLENKIGVLENKIVVLENKIVVLENNGLLYVSNLYNIALLVPDNSIKFALVTIIASIVSTCAALVGKRVGNQVPSNEVILKDFMRIKNAYKVLMKKESVPEEVPSNDIKNFITNLEQDKNKNTNFDIKTFVNFNSNPQMVKNGLISTIQTVQSTFDKIKNSLPNLPDPESLSKDFMIIAGVYEALNGFTLGKDGPIPFAG